VIRDEMEQTRASLADKLGALEDQVRETVSSAQDAVSSTVDGVKEVVSTVSDTVGAVKEQFSISKQFDENPWLCMGAAVAAGFVAAQLLNRAGAALPSALASALPKALGDLPLQLQRPADGAPRPAESKQQGNGTLHALESMLPDMSGVVNAAVSQLGGLAIGSLMGVICEMAANHLPAEWKGEVSKFVEQVADQLGGKPLDPTRSNQILGALGLGEKKDEGNANGHGGQRQEGATYDQARQTGAFQAEAPPSGGGSQVTGRFPAR